MEKELQEKLKGALEREKASLQKELESFATQDPENKANWAAKRINAEDTDMEEKADEVEEYDNLLSLEHSLELKLKDVNQALEKIAAGTYGTCEKCGQAIENERLEICPEGKLCMKCNTTK